jgi:hypothetical protein
MRVSYDPDPTLLLKRGGWKEKKKIEFEQKIVVEE